MLEIKNISKSYMRASQSFYAVNNVNLNIEKGDFIHIIGRSGSGKSTLLNILAGLLSADKGEVLLEGQNYTLLEDEEKSKFRNENIGFIPQSPALLSYLNVLENIRLAYDLYHTDGSSEEKARYFLKSEEHTSELQSRQYLVCRLLLEKKHTIL